jgi:hypothetical protein
LFGCPSVSKYWRNNLDTFASFPSLVCQLNVLRKGKIPSITRESNAAPLGLQSADPKQESPNFLYYDHYHPIRYMGNKQVANQLFTFIQNVWLVRDKHIFNFHFVKLKIEHFEWEFVVVVVVVQ